MEIKNTVIASIELTLTVNKREAELLQMVMRHNNISIPAMVAKDNGLSLKDEQALTRLMLGIHNGLNLE